MLTIKEAIDKVKKLLALSKSDNINESALAMAQAQKIIDKFGIEHQMLNDKVVEEIIDSGSSGEKPFVQFNQRTIKWKTILATTIARHNHCELTLSWFKVEGKLQSSKLNIIGTRNDIEASRFMYEYISNEIERLCYIHPLSRGGGKTWSNSYKLGAVATIDCRLAELRKIAIEEIKEENANNSTALVRIDQALVRITEKENMVKQYYQQKTANSTRKNWHGERLNHHAYMSGKKDAENIRLGHQELE